MSSEAFLMKLQMARHVGWEAPNLCKDELLSLRTALCEKCTNDTDPWSAWSGGGV